jgi:hypothetical protein
VLSSRSRHGGDGAPPDVSPPARRTTAAALLRGAAAAGLLAAGLAPMAAAPAAAEDKICVALVVDYGDLGAGVDSDCVTVAAGSSGEQVLRAKHSVGFRPNQPGFVCTIDGWPREGCGASTGEHYWAYFHRAPGSSSWTYSTSGASGYRPANRSTEGWVWLTRDDQKPADVAYSSICTPTATPTHAPEPTATRPTRDRHTATTDPTSDATADPVGTTTGDRPRHRASATPTGQTRRRPSAATSLAPALTITPSTTATAAPLAADPGGGAGAPYGLAAGAAVVLGVGAAAAYRARRTRGEP